MDHKALKTLGQLKSHSLGKLPVLIALLIYLRVLWQH